MFSAGEARCDRWQDLAHAAQTLVAQSSSAASTKETLAKVPALGYTVPYAIGNILLTAWGPVLVAMMS